MMTLKIYSLSNFQICNILLLTVVIGLYIASPGLIYFMTRNLYHFDPLLPLLSFPGLNFWSRVTSCSWIALNVLVEKWSCPFGKKHTSINRLAFPAELQHCCGSVGGWHFETYLSSLSFFFKKIILLVSVFLFSLGDFVDGGGVVDDAGQSIWRFFVLGKIS